MQFCTLTNFTCVEFLQLNEGVELLDKPESPPPADAPFFKKKKFMDQGDEVNQMRV